MMYSEWHQLVDWVIFQILQKALVLLNNYTRPEVMYSCIII
jgi:hypothetical protein